MGEEALPATNGGQGCCSTPYNTQDREAVYSALHKEPTVKMSRVVLLKRPGFKSQQAHYKRHHEKERHRICTVRYLTFCVRGPCSSLVILVKSLIPSKPQFFQMSNGDNLVFSRRHW